VADLTAGQLRTVRALLQEHVPGVEVRAFGSRVRGNARPWSDLDLVLIGPEPIPRPVLNRLEEAFAESDLPFRVDVVDWQRIDSAFRRQIEEAFEVIQEGATEDAPPRS